MAEPPSLNQMMQQLQRAQVEMQIVREKLKSEFVEIASGDGVATVKMSGDSRLIEITFDPELTSDRDLEQMGQSAVEAVNEALRTVAALADKRIGSLAEGLGLSGPGDTGGPGGGLGGFGGPGGGPGSGGPGGGPGDPNGLGGGPGSGGPGGGPGSGGPGGGPGSGGPGGGPDGPGGSA